MPCSVRNNRLLEQAVAAIGLEALLEQHTQPIQILSQPSGRVGIYTGGCASGACEEQPERRADDHCNPEFI
jgi:hypothetical protein